MRVSGTLAGPALALALLLAAPAAAVDKNKARYVSGGQFSVPADAEGTIATADGRLLFVADAGAGVVDVRFAAIVDVKYGQSVEKSLFRKKREHYIWVTYEDPADAETERTLQLELGKDVVLRVLDGLEQGTGRRVLYRRRRSGALQTRAEALVALSARAARAVRRGSRESRGTGSGRSAVGAPRDRPRRAGRGRCSTGS